MKNKDGKSMMDGHYKNNQVKKNIKHLALTGANNHKIISKRNSNGLDVVKDTKSL